MKTSEKPSTKANAWISTRRRAAGERSAVRSATDMPVMNETYEGNRGSTHGDRKENSTAVHEAALPVLEVEALHRRHLFAARSAPGRPEVHEDRLAALALQPEGLSPEQRHGEVRGLLGLGGPNQIELPRRLIDPTRVGDAGG